jgi:hypothetical protein
MPQCATRLALIIAVIAFALGCGADKDPGPRYMTRAGTTGGLDDIENPIAGADGAGNGGNAAAAAGGQAGSIPAGSGGSVSIGDDCAAISETAQNQLQPADIIFAIDNSGSMDEEIAFVRAELNRFSQLITDSGIDVRIIVISAPLQDEMPMPDPIIDLDDDSDEQDNGVCIDAPLGSGSCPDDSAAPRYVHVPQEVKSSDALNLFIDTYPQWSAQLRPSSTKTFVVVTDDDATDEPITSASLFTNAVAGLVPAFGDFTFSGIYCFSECPDAAEIGRVYIDLVAQTSGVAGDLCLQDFAPVFDALASAVIGASGLDCEWAIPAPPMGQTLQVGLVNVQYTPSTTGVAETVLHRDDASACATNEGWHYDDNTAPTKVLACPATCDRLQADATAKIDVLFGCETLDGPD